MSDTPANDAELLQTARRELFSAVIGDVMDKLGLRRQFLPQPIQALDPRMVLAGRAMPVLEADFFEEVHSGSAGHLSERPFGLMLEALDDLHPGEVYVCTGGSHRYALWGELMTCRALRCGAAGAVCDGFTRDTVGVLAQGFPVFSRGRYAQDQGPRGKVIDFRVPIEMDGGVRIAPGDILFGDIDGVCVIPRAAESDVFPLALEKARAEKTVRKAIEEGMTARDAFAKFGIL